MRTRDVITMLSAAGLCVGVIAKDAPVAPDPKAVEVIRELGLVESDPALREARGWKAPKKIVLLPMGPAEALQAAAPGVKFVVVNSAAEMVREAADADAVGGVDNTVCDDAVLAAAKKLKWIAVYSAGVEACLGKPAIEKAGIVVTNMRAIAGPVMAEHSIALMLALSRGLQVYVPRQAQGGHWNERSRGVNMVSLDGKTMLVAGLGGIGLEVARRAHALGMNVIATRNSSRDKPDYVSYVGLADELPTLIGQADVVVSALPLVPATTNLFDAKMLARMKK
ncbi:MAG TPA: NAD(P)-dependent oxidoreductase, partial [Steroidobacteraceae bacterium]|nr:NAD(P)-dependent oxidoreductase [Steroidobacteraceae bacterium]